MKSIAFTIFLFLGYAILLNAQSHGNNQVMFGIYSNPVSKKKANKLGYEEPTGVLVTRTINNTVAEAAGFQPFDYIYQMGEQKFESHESMSSMMRNFQVGDTIMIKYVRKGTAMSTEVVLGRKSDAVDTKVPRTEDPFLGIENNHEKVPANIQGVSVDIVQPSTAAFIGLQDNDVITYINGYPTLDWHDLGAAIDATKVGDTIDVTFVRNKEVLNAKGPIQSIAATKDQKEQLDWTYHFSYKNEEESTEQSDDAYTEDMEIDMENVKEVEADLMKEETGVDMPVVQNLQIEQLAIFPNPTAARFNLVFDLPGEDKIAVRIFNAQGQIIFQDDRNLFTGEYREEINLGDRPAGTYFVMIQQGRNSVSKKLIVARP